MARTKVFISYSQKDQRWLEKLTTHLKPLARQVDVDLWDDRRIAAGDVWRDEIQKALDAAAVGVLLVSPDFLASDFIAKNEIPTLLEAASAAGTQILCLYVRASVADACRYEYLDRATGTRRTRRLTELQGLNAPSQPLAWRPAARDEVLAKAARVIGDAVARSATATSGVPAPRALTEPRLYLERPAPGDSVDKQRSVEGRAGTGAIRSEPSTVAWAHVSDFHFKAKTDYGRDEVMQALLRDLEMVSGQRAPARGVEPVALDFVVVTGDVAYSGQPEQYEVAQRFFEALSKATQVPRERIFVVPGNHDVDRDRDVTEEVVVSGPEGLERYWGKLAKRRSISREKLAAYREFATQLNEHLRAPEEQPGGFAHTLEIRGHKIALLGLSSCWLSGRDGEQGHLLVGKPQLYDLAGGAGLPGLAEAGLKLALLHHPLTWLQEFDKDDMESLLAEHVDAVLHGHLHKPGLTLQSTPGQVLRTIAAGAAYAGSQYPNAYNIARATLGAERTIDFWLREYVPGHRCFVADNRTYPAATNGRWTWTLTSAAAAEPPPMTTLGAPVPMLVPLDVRPYLRRLVEKTRWLEVRGMGAKVAEKLELERVYTNLRVMATSEETEPSRPAGRGKIIRDIEQAHDRQLHEVLREHAVVVLIGDPGAGKTTFLSFVALNLARALLGDDREACLMRLGLAGDVPFPLLVSLAAFGQFLNRQPDAGLDDHSPLHFARYLDALIVEKSLPLPSGYLWKRLQAGGCFLLLDGLDEVATDPLRRRVRAILDELALVSNRYLVTCRTRAYEGLAQLAPTFAACRLVDFGATEMDAFATNWSRALHRVPREETTSDRAQRASAYARGLLAAVRAHAHIRRLATNPLMLTILAVVYWDDKRLPEQRADLYEAAVKKLLDTRTATHPAALRRECLQRIALRMFEDPQGVRKTLGRAQAAAVVSEFLRLDERAALDFIEEEELHSGLLVSRIHGEVEFQHLTFAEYLAAQALSSRRDCWERLRPHLRDERWGEVILLLAGCRRRDGIDAVGELIAAIVADVCEASDVERARSVGLVGRVLRDIEAYGGDPAHGTGYAAALKRTLASFERGSKVPEKLRIEVGEALGQAGDPRIHDDDLENRVRIEGGTFLMGAQSKVKKRPGHDPEAFADEGPAHEVTLSPFWIDRYPVTVQKFRRFVEAGSEGYLAEEFWSEAGWAWRVKASREAPGSWEKQLRHPNRPATEVSWYEATAYCAWMSARHARDGWRVVLPTEAQWEYTARGREGRKYPWGVEEPSDERANFAMRVGAPTPVGIYPLGATPEGVHDLAGNVLEWCADWFGRYEMSSEPDPVGSRDGTSRVLRGGAFDIDPGSLRAAYRLCIHPGGGHADVGFRCVWVGVGRTE